MAALQKVTARGCAENTAHFRRVLWAAAAPMEGKAFCWRHGGKMASALLQGARQRVEQDLVSVANTVRLGPTQCLGGLWEAWWEGSVQRQRAAHLLSLVESARNTALMGSALSAVAAVPPCRQQKERAPSMAAADRKCARRKAAPRLPKHAASAPSTGRTDRASVTAAPPTHVGGGSPRYWNLAAAGSDRSALLSQHKHVYHVQGSILDECACSEYFKTSSK